MKALSIRQPWAWLILQGFKPVENRSWETLYRGPLLIHAGQTMTRANYEACMLFIASDPRIAHIACLVPMPDQLVRGGIVGQADLVGCVRSDPSPWFVGDFGWQLRNAAATPFRPLKGALGLFNVHELQEVQ